MPMIKIVIVAESPIMCNEMFKTLLNANLIINAQHKRSDKLWFYLTMSTLCLFLSNSSLIVKFCANYCSCVCVVGVEDPVVEEHFRRSLGNNYTEYVRRSSSRSPSSASPPVSPMSSAMPRSTATVIRSHETRSAAQSCTSQSVRITGNDSCHIFTIMYGYLLSCVRKLVTLTFWKLGWVCLGFFLCMFHSI